MAAEARHTEGTGQLAIRKYNNPWRIVITASCHPTTTATTISKTIQCCKEKIDRAMSISGERRPFTTLLRRREQKLSIQPFHVQQKKPQDGCLQRSAPPTHQLLCRKRVLFHPMPLPVYSKESYRYDDATIPWERCFSGWLVVTRLVVRHRPKSLTERIFFCERARLWLFNRTNFLFRACTLMVGEIFNRGM